MLSNVYIRVQEILPATSDGTAVIVLSAHRTSDRLCPPEFYLSGVLTLGTQYLRKNDAALAGLLDAALFTTATEETQVCPKDIHRMQSRTD